MLFASELRISGIRCESAAYAVTKAVREIRQTSDIACILPERLASALLRAFDENRDIYELRLIRDRAAFLVTPQGIRFLRDDGTLSASPGLFSLALSQDELEEIVSRAAGYSGFAHESELRRSFLTRPDGTRIGIASSCAEGGLPSGIRSLNIRFPYCQTESAAVTAEAVLGDLSGGVLIAGPPNCGKTTLLRGCCKYLGDGGGGEYRKICVIDERGELAGEGGCFDLGACTDVIAGRDKREAILTAIRLLSPQVVVCDEIGSDRESESILEGLNSGVIFLASMHAKDLRQLVRRSQFLRLFRENVFERVVIMDPCRKGAVREIHTYEEVADEIRRSGGAFIGGAADRFYRESETQAAHCLTA